MFCDHLTMTVLVVRVQGCLLNKVFVYGLMVWHSYVENKMDVLKKNEYKSHQWKKSLAFLTYKHEKIYFQFF